MVVLMCGRLYRSPVRVSNKNRLLGGIAVVLLVHVSCARQPVRHPGAEGKEIGHEEGIASWYGRRFRGRKTASGRRFNPKELTAAHRTLPFGTKVKVTNLENDKDVEVTINDRGPFVRNRIIDLSQAAAHRIGMSGAGVARVRIEVLDGD